MSRFMRLRNKPRRGQATIIGGVMFLLIAMLLTGYLLEMFTVQREMNLRDVRANQERLEISEIFFGAEAEYTPEYPPVIVTEGEGIFNESGDPYFNISSAVTAGVANPLGNGDFASSSEGWYFTYSYIDATYGASGAYTNEATGSQTGTGAIFMDFYYNPAPSKYAYATLNWSTQVYFDLESLGEGIDSITLDYGYFTTTHRSVDESTLEVYLVDSENVEFPIDSIDISDFDDEWQIVEDAADLKTFISVSGWYTLVFTADVQLKPLSSDRPEFKVFIDDVSINVNFHGHVLDWEFAYVLNQDSITLSTLEMVFSSHYDTSVIQSLYIIDQASGRSVLLSRSTMSDSEVKLTFPISGSDIQKYISQDNNNITFRIYTVSANPFRHVGATPTLDIAYTGDQENILISLRNPGGVSFTVKSLWINDYTGHTQFEVDLRVSPGDIYTYQASYNWTGGEFTIKAITDKGSKAVTKATAK